MHPDFLGEFATKKNPSKDKCHYLGVCELGDVHIAADTEEELNKVIEECKKDRSGVNGFLLRHREKPHIRMQFNPVEMPEIEDPSEWTMLEVAVDDPRRLLYVLEGADGTKMLDLTKSSKDHVVRLGVVYDNLVGQEEVIDGLQKPVFKDGENNSLLLTTRTKRVCGLYGFIDILYKMSIGIFLRLLEVNVDNNQRIGPLVPPCNIDDDSFPEYVRLFGCDPRHAAFLGLEIQRSPSPHPMRSYDANRLWLIQEFGPGIQRDQRKGPGFLEENREEAERMLVSSFVTKTIGNPCVLDDWSHRLQENALIQEEEEEEQEEEEDQESESEKEERDGTEFEDDETTSKNNKGNSQPGGDSDGEEDLKSCQIPGNPEEVASFIAFIDTALEKKGQESFSVLLNGCHRLPKLL
jgi:hypothetical protein